MTRSGDPPGCRRSATRWPPAARARSSATRAGVTWGRRADSSRARWIPGGARASVRPVLGFSFGEILMLILVGIVVVGPRKLPTLMRTAGQWVGKLRRMSTDLRAQSGIDDLIRQEGLEREIREL